MTIALIIDSDKPLKYKKLLIDVYIQQLRKEKIIPDHIIE